ncbi:lysylphosphatidylglycerol synthase domain-containing protein, partial [Streptomyces sp. NPDC001617]
MSAPVDVPVGVGARAPWQTLIAVVAVAVGAGLAVRHWPVLDAGADQLVVADRGWLSLAALLSVLTWAGAALALQGAVREALPAGRLVAAQFAASAANHVLPAGLGAGAVNLRFLTRCGLAPGRAATALAVKGAAGAVVRVGLVAGLAVACPGVLRLPSVGGTKLVVGAVVAGAAAAAAVGVAVRLGRQARHRQRTALPRQTGLGQRTALPQRTGLGQQTALPQRTGLGQQTALPQRTG